MTPPTLRCSAEHDCTTRWRLAAATDNDTSNLSVLAAARRANPGLFLVARQNDPSNAPLFEALHVESVLVPTRLVAHEVLARISDPTLWRFVQEAQRRSDDWSAELLDRLTSAVLARFARSIWTLPIDAHGAPSVTAFLAHADVTVGRLLRDPQDRDRTLDVVPLMIERGHDVILTPGDDEPVHPGDVLLLTGMPYDRRALDTTVSVPAATEYVLTGQRVGQSWLWRTLVDR